MRMFRIADESDEIPAVVVSAECVESTVRSWYGSLTSLTLDARLIQEWADALVGGDSELAQALGEQLGVYGEELEPETIGQ